MEQKGGIFTQANDASNNRFECDRCHLEYAKDNYIRDLRLCNVCARHMKEDFERTERELQEIEGALAAISNPENQLAMYRIALDLLYQIKFEYWDRGFFRSSLKPEKIDHYLRRISKLHTVALRPPAQSAYSQYAATPTRQPATATPDPVYPQFSAAMSGSPQPSFLRNTTIERPPSYPARQQQTTAVDNAPPKYPQLSPDTKPAPGSSGSGPIASPAWEPYINKQRKAEDHSALTSSTKPQMPQR